MQKIKDLAIKRILCEIIISIPYKASWSLSRNTDGRPYIVSFFGKKKSMIDTQPHKDIVFGLIRQLLKLARGKSWQDPTYGNPKSNLCVAS